MGVISKIRQRLGRYKWDKKIQSLTLNGDALGKKIAWFSPDITIDSTRPYLLHIGDNCFIGMNSVILMGTQIGNNCIVGAGNVVHGTFPDNVVVAGNMAKIICTLDEHYQKRRERTIEEAKECAAIIKQRLNREPTAKDLIGFRFLFTPRTNEALRGYGVENFACNGDEPDEVKKAFFETTPYWESFEDFLKDI